MQEDGDNGYRVKIFDTRNPPRPAGANRALKTDYSNVPELKADETQMARQPAQGDGLEAAPKARGGGYENVVSLSWMIAANVVMNQNH